MSALPRGCMMEEDREEGICDNLEDEDWEPSDIESEQSIQFEPDAEVQSDKDLDNLFKCSLCPKSYTRQSNINRHKKIHNKNTISRHIVVLTL
ncbi:zinc finger protein 454-like [Drosophila persimilis]|uniref:zinc finger protein 454-like n=1 Tax=Drosophila persimilis TaxID=7234 RepID=UPI000F0836BB|nr:zinc finger protein 454-like [Drosophila persimilis]